MPLPKHHICTYMRMYVHMCTSKTFEQLFLRNYLFQITYVDNKYSRKIFIFVNSRWFIIIIWDNNNGVFLEISMHQNNRSWSKVYYSHIYFCFCVYFDCSILHVTTVLVRLLSIFLPLTSAMMLFHCAAFWRLTLSMCIIGCVSFD